MTKRTVDNKDKMCSSTETSLIGWEKMTGGDSTLIGRVNHLGLYIITPTLSSASKKYKLENWYLVKSTLVSDDIDELKAAAEDRLKSFMALAGFTFDKAVRHG